MLPPITLEFLVITIGLMMLLIDSFRKNRNLIGPANLCILSLCVTFILSFYIENPDSSSGVGYLKFYAADHTSLFFKRLAILSTIVVLVCACDYVRGFTARQHDLNSGVGHGAFFAIPLFTCAGLMFMASATDLLTVFVSLELVTVSFYVLVAYARANATCLEAGVKYLILGALGTGFFAYGITWMFGLTGEIQLSAVGSKLAQLSSQYPAILFTFCLIFVGIGFKVAAAPFHWWVPDVYQGAPTPITAFLSVGSKAAGFLLLLRVVEPFLEVPLVREKVLLVLSFSAFATVIFGNLAAIPQTHFKRLLAYSSIGHAGYLLMAIASVGPASQAFRSVGASIGFYLLGYMLTTLLAFLIHTLVASNSEGEDLSIFNGLLERSPFLSLALIVSMASLAGLPLTVGFYGKFLVFGHCIQAGKFVLLGAGVLAVASGFYFYLRVLAASFWQDAVIKESIPVPFTTKLVICLLMLGIIFFGISPSSVISYLTDMSVSAAIK